MFPGQVSRPDLACYSPKHCCLSAKAPAEPGPALFFAQSTKPRVRYSFELDLPDNQTGLPFTYEHDGKQYLAMFVGGSGNPAQLVAYALP